MPYFSDIYANASSVYDIAAKSRRAVEKAREQVAKAIGAQKDEIYFTAAGSRRQTTGLLKERQML